jgi:hypothetical protein
VEYASKRRKTRREVFLEEMERVVPWKAQLGLIEPHYPVAGRGLRPYPLESMLRVHLMQNWFALSDPAMEEALYEIASLRAFARLSLGEPIPANLWMARMRLMAMQAAVRLRTNERRGKRRKPPSNAPGANAIALAARIGPPKAPAFSRYSDLP